MARKMLGILMDCTTKLYHFMLKNNLHQVGNLGFFDQKKTIVSLLFILWHLLT